MRSSAQTLFLAAAGRSSFPQSVRWWTLRSLAQHGKQILLVDDDAAVRKSTAALLEGAGYQVTTAHTGRAALDVFDRLDGAIDIVLTDLDMPDMGGRALVGALRAKRPDVPVLYLSGWSDRHIDERDPCTGFLDKPFRAAELFDKVEAVIAARGLARTPPG